MGDFATVSHLLRSKMCGEEFDVKVLLPFSYTITEGAQLHYPTIYLLDPEPCLLPLLVRVHFAKVPANTKSHNADEETSSGDSCSCSLCSMCTSAAKGEVVEVLFAGYECKGVPLLLAHRQGEAPALP